VIIRLPSALPLGLVAEAVSDYHVVVHRAIEPTHHEGIPLSVLHTLVPTETPLKSLGVVILKRGQLVTLLGANLRIVLQRHFCQLQFMNECNYRI
jgi:hypothetical protein